MMVPMLGRGTGTGLGGMRLGGCAWQCGGPMYMEKSVTAGMAGTSFASGAVIKASPVSSNPNATPATPRTPLTLRLMAWSVVSFGGGGLMNGAAAALTTLAIASTAT